MSHGMVRMVGVLALLLSGGVIHRAEAQRSVRYVDIAAAGAGGAHNGASWSDAYTNLWEALSTESSAQEFWVAQGVYGPTNLTTAVAATLQGDILYGGFAGSETDVNQRNWNSHATIITGDVDNDGTSDIIPDSYAPSVNDAIERPLLVTAAVPGPQLDGFTLQYGNNVGTHSRHGGALYVANTDMTIRNCVFRHNVSSRGGAVAVRGGSLVTSCHIENSLFYANTCASNNLIQAGAIYTYQNGAATGVSLLNCTFASNAIAARPDGSSSDTGIAGADVSLHSLLTGGATFRNCIFWSATNGIAEGMDPVITYADVRQADGTHAGTGNLNRDPNFVAAGSHDYHLLGGPCVDAGDNAGVALLDLDHADRIQGASVDMGAFEMVSGTGGTTTTTSTTTTSAAGDPTTSTTTTTTTSTTSTTALPLVTAGVVYVSHGATGAANGTSWADAYTTIQTAVASESAGTADTPKPFWIRAGTYYRTTATNQIALKAHHQLYGGFVGNETNLEARNWAVNPTILDGAGLNGMATAYIKGPGAGTPALLLDGLTIQNCYSSTKVGAVYIWLTEAWTMRHCTFRHNVGRYGSAIGQWTATLTVENSLFVGNTNITFVNQGGAIWTRARPCTATIVNCTFAENATAATLGGAPQYNNDLFKSASCALVIRNTILASGGPGRNYSPINAGANITYSDVLTNGVPYAGTGNILAEPLFMNAAGGDYRLQAGSPALNGGTAIGAPQDDLDGTRRPQGPGMDMGAYEQLDGGGIVTTSTTTTTTTTGDEPTTTSTTSTTTTSTTSTTSSTALPPGAATVVYVDATAVGSGNGTSWADAYVNIRTAVVAEAAGTAVNPKQFWIKAGTYARGAATEQIVLKAQHQLFGGFSGTETHLAERDWASNPTVIDGAGINGLSTAYIRGPSSGTPSLMLDGLTIQNCYSSSKVGGIYVWLTEDWSIRHCTFRHNVGRYGSAIGLWSATLNVENCLFVGNTNITTVNQGGAIWTRARPCTANIVNSTFAENATAAVLGSPPQFNNDVYRSASCALTIRNCILASGGPARQFSPVNAGAAITYSDVLTNGAPYAGTGNLNADPRFRDAAAGDYRVQAASPTLDAGTGVGAPLDDLDGTVRPQGTGVDMGAYEALDGSVTTTTTTTSTSSTTTTTTTSTTTTAWPPVLAEQSSVGYHAGELTRVHGQFSYPPGQALLGLRWIVALPPGWTMESVTGDGGPQVRGNEIVFAGDLAANPVAFSYTLNVPPDDALTQSVAGVAEYMMEGMVDPLSIPAQPDPLPLSPMLALTIDSAYAGVTPTTGTHLFPAGTAVVGAALNPFVDISTGVRDACTSWMGEGSAPSTGMGTHVSFTLDMDSRLSWQWQRQHLLELDASGLAGTLSASTGWLAAGTTNVITATPNRYWVFSSWNGDTNGCRLDGNVVTVPMDQPRAIAAIFRIDTNVIALSQMSTDYYSPSTSLVVRGQFRYPDDDALTTLAYVPVMPDGWSITSVSGDGDPVLSGNSLVLFRGPLNTNPVAFDCVVAISGNQAVTNLLYGNAYFSLASMAHPVLMSAAPLALARYHSADYRAANWEIDGQEVNRVLAYWRAGGYDAHAGSRDGYSPTNAPGSLLSTTGWHSADYAEPRGSISAAEAARVLAYWSSGGYHVEAAGLDGYAPMAPGPTPTGVDGAASIEQLGPASYEPSGVVVVTNIVTYDGGLLALYARPTLPEGWVIESVSGDGDPEVQRGDVLWTQGVPPSPIRLTLTLRVPYWERSPRDILGEWAYFGARAPNATTTPSPALRLVPSALDADRDGLPDTWEGHFAGGGGNLAPDQDADGDGMPNGAEWIAGTDPVDAESQLRVDAIDVQADGHFRVQWSSVPNRHYTLWRSATLPTVSVEAVESNMPATAPVNVTEDAMDSAASVFYWLEVQ
ncbi:MAG: hypothetical protein K8T26_02085 [Lentisphaerae bacterium]|nr:hypothetical protein [Lentisphaerota bacterium]